MLQLVVVKEGVVLPDIVDLSYRPIALTATAGVVQGKTADVSIAEGKFLAFWDQIGGDKSLPETIQAADRFVRLSYNLKSSPKFKDPRLAVASVFSQMREIGVPLGMEDPNHPNTLDDESQTGS